MEHRIQSLRLLTDGDGQAFYEQAIRAMVGETSGTFQVSNENRDREEQAVRQKLGEILNEEGQSMPEVDNPITAVEGLKQRSLLSLICPAEETLSNRSVTVEELAFDAACYADGEPLTNPYISPLYGDLTGMPPSLLFAGGAELLLDDMKAMFARLRAAGCQARRFIAPEMWHAYVLYGVEEAEPDFVRIADFVHELFEES